MPCEPVFPGSSREPCSSRRRSESDTIHPWGCVWAVKNFTGRLRLGTVAGCPGHGVRSRSRQTLDVQWGAVSCRLGTVAGCPSHEVRSRSRQTLDVRWDAVSCQLGTVAGCPSHEVRSRSRQTLDVFFRTNPITQPDLETETSNGHDILTPGSPRLRPGSRIDSVHFVQQVK